MSYSDELPQKDFTGTVRLKDLWACAQAQELALVLPEMHEEFVLGYEKRLLEPFGLTGYGCCEDLTNKLDHIFRIPHIRRISISPFADVARCAAKLKGDYIFSWKPHPAHMVGRFKEDMIRQYIRRTLEALPRQRLRAGDDPQGYAFVQPSPRAFHRLDANRPGVWSTNLLGPSGEARAYSQNNNSFATEDTHTGRQRAQSRYSNNAVA